MTHQIEVHSYSNDDQSSLRFRGQFIVENAQRVATEDEAQALHVAIDAEEQS